MSDLKGVTVVNTANTAPKLTKKNYPQWVINMGILIRTQNEKLWDYIDEHFPKDEKPTAPLSRRQKRELADLMILMITAKAMQMLSSPNYEDGEQL